MDTRPLNIDAMSDEELKAAAQEAADYAMNYEMGQGASYLSEATQRRFWQSRRSLLQAALKARRL
jgi:FAD/FMN-containing dehydrogenase